MTNSELLVKVKENHRAAQVCWGEPVRCCIAPLDELIPFSYLLELFSSDFSDFRGLPPPLPKLNGALLSAMIFSRFAY